MLSKEEEEEEVVEKEERCKRVWISIALDYTALFCSGMSRTVVDSVVVWWLSSVMV